jgi:hypothetical protein
MVLKLATRIYMEGELDESGLTFNDLNYIEKMFTRMLLSIHHHRITYPEFQVPHGYTGEAAPQAVPDPSPPAAPEHEPPEPEARAHRRRLAGD